MKSTRGYTLVETLLAAGILMVGIAAAASLALTMVSQEEANARVARALNLQEQAARLYQLGLEPSEITAILPPEDTVTSVSFSPSDVTVSGVGEVQMATCTIIFNSGAPITDPSSTTEARTNEVVLVRPTIR